MSDCDHGILELFSMLILGLFPTFAAVPKIFFKYQGTKVLGDQGQDPRTDLSGKIIHGPSYSEYEPENSYQVILNLMVDWCPK